MRMMPQRHGIVSYKLHNYSGHMHPGQSMQPTDKPAAALSHSGPAETTAEAEGGAACAGAETSGQSAETK